MNDPWPILLKHAFLAMLGGLVRVLVNDERYTLTRFFAGAVIGIFTGLVVFFGCRHMELGEYLTLVCVCLGGYVGTPLLDILSNRMKGWTKPK